MKNLPLASSILLASVRAAEPYGVPVTVKFRNGWDDQSKNAVEFSRMCIDSGAAAMTLHARTRNQMYSGKADWTLIREVAEASRGTGVPLFGNGDVIDGESAVSMMTGTGCDGVMIGRAAQGNPWIFREIVAALRGSDGERLRDVGSESFPGESSEVFREWKKPAPPAPEERAAKIWYAPPAPEERAAKIWYAPPVPEERAAIIREHLHGLSERLGERTAVLEMRAQLAMYFKGQPYATSFKVAAMSAETMTEVESLLAEWVKIQTPRE